MRAASLPPPSLRIAADLAAATNPAAVEAVCWMSCLKILGREKYQRSVDDEQLHIPAVKEKLHQLMPALNL